MENLQYPIGRFDFNNSASIPELIQDIADLPQQVSTIVQHWEGNNNLSQVYRPDGWTGAQVIHHLADSHMNAYIRFKLALTEDTPTVKPYLEGEWAKFEDGQATNITSSLQILTGIHQRWTTCLKNMSIGDFDRCFYHPESRKEISLAENLAMYSWHSRHHLGHLEIIDQRFSV